jgi:hypothetical protein
MARQEIRDIGAFGIIVLPVLFFKDTVETHGIGNALWIQFAQILAYN